MLMCKRHWSMVPRVMQRAVWDTYRYGQEITKDPSSEYLEAAGAAIRAVADKEGRRDQETGRRVNRAG